MPPRSATPKRGGRAATPKRGGKRAATPKTRPEKGTPKRQGTPKASSGARAKSPAPARAKSPAPARAKSPAVTKAASPKPAEKKKPSAAVKEESDDGRDEEAETLAADRETLVVHRRPIATLSLFAQVFGNFLVETSTSLGSDSRFWALLAGVTTACYVSSEALSWVIFAAW